MNYAPLEELNNMSDNDAQQCEELISALETVLEREPFKNMPRSFRFLGAGYGCMQIFCSNGLFKVLRNNGQDIDVILECDDIEKTFCKLISMIYGTRKPDSFAHEQYDQLFSGS